MSGCIKCGLIGRPYNLSLQTGCFREWKGTLTRRNAGITGVKLDYPVKPGHVVTLGLGCLYMHISLRRAAASNTHRATGPGGVLLSVPGPIWVIPYSPSNMKCSFLPEYLFILFSQPGEHILLGVSQTVFFGPGPWNLPFPSVPIPTLCPRAFALCCKMLMANLCLEPSAFNSMPGIWREGSYSVNWKEPLSYNDVNNLSFSGSLFCVISFVT